MLVTEFIGEQFDAKVFNPKGGTVHTVRIDDAWNGEHSTKTFRGKNSRTRAIEYARKVTGYEAD